MKNAIILHGRPSKEQYFSPELPSSSNFGWIPWLQKQLIIKEIKADTPEIPYCYDPNYTVWKKEFERYQVNENTLLIGHSAGGGFLLRWLSEEKNQRAKKLILVAPGMSLFAKNYDLIDELLLDRVGEFIIFTSDNDPGNSSANTKMISERIKGTKIIELKGYGHFVPDHMGKAEFPELLEEVIK